MPIKNSAKVNIKIQRDGSVIYCFYELSSTAICSFIFCVYFFSPTDLTKLATSVATFESLCPILLCIFPILTNSTIDYTHFSTLRGLIFPSVPSVNTALWYLKFMSVMADTLDTPHPHHHRSMSSQCFPATFQFSVREKKKKEKLCGH